MSELFNRRAVVTLIPREAGSELRVEGLHIAFEVRKTVRAQSNKATVDLYNLAKSTRDRFHAKRDVLRVDAGYRGVFETIYEGEINEASSGRSVPDFVTRIECGDGDEAFQAQSVEQEFPAGTRVRDVIKRVAGAFTQPVPDQESPVLFGPAPKETKPSRIRFRSIDADLAALEVDLSSAGFAIVLRRAFTVSGNAAEVMDRLARMWRFDWSVQDGVFQITSYGRAVVGESILLTPKTGLIGTPLKTEQGVKFAAFLIPQVRPGVLCTIESENVRGSFRVEDARFLGDTEGSDWLVEAEARSLEAV
jgi:hypothetical protein